MKLIPKQPFEAWVEITREIMRVNLSRRAMLAAGGFAALTVAARAASGLGNPDLPPEGAANVTNPKALTDPGPQDPGIAGHEPSFLNPPATDVNGMPQFWASFNLAPKRIQNGGWVRQITQDDFHNLDDHRWRQHAPGPGRRPRAPLASTGRVGRRDLRQLSRDDSGPGRPAASRECEGRRFVVFSGCPIRCRAWTLTEQSLSWPSTTANPPSSTPCW
jgi:hypothetical protein